MSGRTEPFRWCNVLTVEHHMPLILEVKIDCEGWWESIGTLPSTGSPNEQWGYQTTMQKSLLHMGVPEVTPGDSTPMLTKVSLKKNGYYLHSSTDMDLFRLVTCCLLRGVPILAPPSGWTLARKAKNFREPTRCNECWKKTSRWRQSLFCISVGSHDNVTRIFYISLAY